MGNGQKYVKNCVFLPKIWFLDSPGRDLSNEGRSFPFGAIPGTNIFVDPPPPNSDQKIPIFFASDNAIALNTVKEWAEEVNYPLIQFDRTEEVPLKLDYYGNETHPTKPSDYYSTFVDLFLAGSGKCVTHGRGGFGRLASLLSYNTSCVTKHINNFLPDKCKGISPFTEKEEEEAAKRKERNDGK